MKITDLNIDRSWTLFLDRDGVINRRLVDDYVKSWDEFEFLPGVLESIAQFSEWFGRIVIVTNQQGVGKKLMSEGDLHDIHNQMVSSILKAGGRIDKIYFCPHLKQDNPSCRKPEPGMGLEAQKDFPEIDFLKSMMVGDSISDMEFGRTLNMFNVFVSENGTKLDDNLTQLNTTSLVDLASILKDNMT